MMLLNAKLTGTVGCGNHYGSASEVYRLPVSLLYAIYLQFRPLTLISHFKGSKCKTRDQSSTQRYLLAPRFLVPDRKQTSSSSSDTSAIVDNRIYPNSKRWIQCFTRKSPTWCFACPFLNRDGAGGSANTRRRPRYIHIATGPSTPISSFY
jgi:hypothetical protein